MKRKALPLIVLLALGLALTPVAVQGEGGPPGLTGGPLADSNASFDGEAAGNIAGYSVAIVGDVNGDGYDDVLIGAPLGSSTKGRAYLLLGGAGGWRLDESLASADAIYTGETIGDGVGYSVAGAGDVNGDGYDDMLIGAPLYSASTGRTYLVLGSGDPTSGSPFDLSSADAKYDGETIGDVAGYSVAGAGDVNGDGYDDMLIGARSYNPGAATNTGRTYLVLGSSSPGDTLLSDASVVKYTGESSDDYAGYSVAGAGDVNGDGYSDLLIGAYTYSTNFGRAYLVLGGSTPSSITLSSADAKYDGESGSFAGFSVAGAGDANGDGYDDMLIGAPAYSGNTGQAYLVLGASSPSSITLSSADAIYIGESSSYAGGSVAGAGDVNGDGYSDLLVGAYTHSSNTGRAYLVLGASSPYSGTLSSADAIYTGESSSYAGHSVAGAGDVNGDGYSDLLIGAYEFNSSRGKAYLLFSDYNSATAARYRDMISTALANANNEVGPSGVRVKFPSGAQTGSIYVTRHFRKTCSTNLDSNRLVWTVDSQRGGSAQAQLTFKYNDTQIAGWTEADLKLWYRERPCQDWTQDTSATLYTITNTITSNTVTDPHREYTIAPSDPGATAVRLKDFGPQLAKEPPWMVVGLAALVIAAAAAEWWRQRLHRQGAP